MRVTECPKHRHPRMVSPGEVVVLFWDGDRSVPVVVSRSMAQSDVYLGSLVAWVRDRFVNGKWAALSER